MTSLPVDVAIGVKASSKSKASPKKPHKDLHSVKAGRIVKSSSRPSATNGPESPMSTTQAAYVPCLQLPSTLCKHGQGQLAWKKK
jgi:hypothetical protein